MRACSAAVAVSSQFPVSLVSKPIRRHMRSVMEPGEFLFSLAFNRFCNLNLFAGVRTSVRVRSDGWNDLSCIHCIHLPDSSSASSKWKHSQVWQPGGGSSALTEPQVQRDWTVLPLSDRQIAAALKAVHTCLRTSGREDESFFFFFK